MALRARWSLARAGQKVECVRRLNSSAKRHQSTTPASPPWRQTTTLDEWVLREARPISLRQLTVFGRSLTEGRLIESANYVRKELPTRLAHRLRDMQTLPYAVITNPNMKHVYDLYYRAFDTFRRIERINTIDENDAYCKILQHTLREHLSVIPRLVVGVLECQGLVNPEQTDKFINTMLRSRISRRVIAEQHLALTQTFHSPMHFTNATRTPIPDNQTEFVGEVFPRCNAKDVVDRCATAIQALSRQAYGPSAQLPEVLVQGDLGATLTYIPSHLEYIIGELLRNSFQAVVEQRRGSAPPAIEVLVCEAPQHVIFRVSDRGGGVPQSILPHLWSFVKGPRAAKTLENLNKVPQLSATLQELKVASESAADLPGDNLDDSAGGGSAGGRADDSSLITLSGRPPNLRLGIGLPMSRVFAEYWAGSLELHSLEGYGVDAFLQISKLGNKNEQLSTRATMDGV